jgi:hypothetical protein
MATIKVSAPKSARNDMEFEFELGSDLEHMVSLFGADVVFENAKQNIIIGFQASVRSKMEAGIKSEKAADGGYRVLEKDKKKVLSDAAIRQKMSEWKPEVRKPVDPAKVQAEMVKKLTKMAPAEKARMMELLRAELGLDEPKAAE